MLASSRRHADAPFVLNGTYFGRQRFEGVEELNGLQMHTLPGGHSRSKAMSRRYRTLVLP
jgi:hypothetical protein